MQAKRILWLINHKTLMQFEVPLLRSLGYEVYTPKIPPFDVSVAVDWESDKRLTVPQADLDVLNAFDFYENYITPEVARVINEHFQIAMFIHTSPTIESLVDAFKGMLVLRAYGRPKVTGSYTDLIVKELGYFTLMKIEKLGARFVFGECYPGLSEIECRFFQDHTLYMPLGMENSTVIDGWTGRKEKVLFSCARIRVSLMYENLYKAFKKDFKGIPYAVSGVQPIPVETDKNVLGFLPKEEYDTLYTDYRCLFYENREPYQLTYPPLEAIRHGMPVVFMAGGMLDKMGGRSLPGRCKTVKEARAMVKKLVDGNRELAKKLRSTQGVLLEKFTEAFCLPHWERAMEAIEAKSAIRQIPIFGRQKKRIAILLPEGYTGGVLDYSINLTRALHRGIAMSGDNVELVFAYRDCEIFEEGDYFKPIREMGIPLRKMEWEPIDPDRGAEILKLKGVEGSLPPLPEGWRYCLPNDGIAYFEDCDFILVTADRIPNVPLILRPYGMVAHDFAQRFLPIIFPGLEFQVFEGLRRAKAVYTTSPVTLERAVQYAGVARERLHLIPLLLSAQDVTEEAVETVAEEGEAPAQAKPYFLWSTNTAQHKKHLETLQALSNYYAMGGKLRCVVTGANTEKMSPKYKLPVEVSEHVQKIRALVQRDKQLQKNMRFMGNLPKAVYKRILAGAKFFYHPGTADNGNGTAMDAAWRGVPTLSNDYKAMRYIEESLHLGMRFFDSSDVDSIVTALFEAENSLEAFAAGVPSPEALFAHSVESDGVAATIYRTVLEASGLQAWRSAP